jgi:hypothetical protein
MTARRVVALLSLQTAIILSAVSCDPCAGVAACTTAPRVAVQGRIVDNVNGHPVPNTRISLVRTDSAGHDSIVTTTDAQGNFQAADDGGSGTFDVVVAPPGLPSYRVKHVALTSSTVHGEGQVLGVWVSTPAVDLSGEVFYRSNPNQLVVNAPVTFKRTGGSHLSIGDGVYTNTTDANGRVPLLSGITTDGLDDVIGELTVTLPGALGTSVLENFHLTPSYVFRPTIVKRFGVGPQLSWIAAIYNRATVARVPGTTITFTRTGGIPTVPESFTTVTNQSGEFNFLLVPQAKGTVIGNLTITPPAPLPAYTKTDFELPTFEADQNPFFADYGVGPHMPWNGIVHCNGQPIPNVTVFVTRVGGISADPQSFYTTSDANGYFRLLFIPHEYGDAIVDLTFAPASGPCIGLVVHNVHIPTLDFDTGIRYLAIWDLPNP